MGWVTQATDDFNRANETPLSGGGNWLNFDGSNNLVSNSAAPSSPGGADAGSLWQGRTWTEDQSSSAILTCTGTSAGCQGVGLYVRGKGSGGPNGYRFVIDHAGASNACIGRVLSNVFTSLDPWTETFVDGDRFTLRVSGPPSAAKLEVLRNGTVVRTFTDNSTLPAGSAPGLCFSNNETAATYDNWEGGEFVGGPGDNPPIGILGRGAGW